MGFSPEARWFFDLARFLDGRGNPGIAIRCVDDFRYSHWTIEMLSYAVLGKALRIWGDVW